MATSNSGSNVRPCLKRKAEDISKDHPPSMPMTPEERTEEELTDGEVTDIAMLYCE
jgi:hypothetical protein